MFINLGQVGCETNGILTVARSWYQMISSLPATQTLIIQYKGESKPATLAFGDITERDAACMALLEYLQEDSNGLSK